MKMKTDYDVTKNMLKTIRTITESKLSKQPINEVAEFESTLSDNADQEQKNDITVINNVDVKAPCGADHDFSIETNTTPRRGTYNM